MNEKTVQLVTIDTESSGQRVDNYLFRISKGVPKTRLYRALRKGEVRVNKKRVQPSYKLQEGDSLRIPPLRVAAEFDAHGKIPPALAAELQSRILYATPELLIIDKPAGMAVHGGSGIAIGLIEALRAIYPQQRYLELVHRLDRDTSGCIMIAKKRSMLRYLHQLLREKRLYKSYLALVKGNWSAEKELVDKPLLKNILSSGERIVKVNAEGKKAITEFIPKEHYGDATLVEVHPRTGRTHQIRVHAAAVGHPIVGDEKYGEREFNKRMRAKGLKRMFLHAWQVGFILPQTEEQIMVTADLGEDWQDL